MASIWFLLTDTSSSYLSRFSNKTFNFKMTNLTYSGESNFKSEENIKNNIIKIFIFYSGKQSKLIINVDMNF